MEPIFLLDFTNFVPLKTGGSRADRWRGRWPRHALRARASTHPAYVVCAADAGQQREARAVPQLEAHAPAAAQVPRRADSPL